MTKKVIVHLGRTAEHADADVWTKAYIGLEYDLPDEVDEEVVVKTLMRLRALVEQELGADMSKIPVFNPDDLMKHAWKGKKTAEGEYEKGSVSWGWDFKDKFPESVLKALEKGPVTIDQYEFTLGGTLVTAKKKGGKAK